MKRPAARLAVLLLLSAAALGATAGAASAQSCGRQVIADWYGSKTGQLSKVYPLHCYREALNIIKGEPDVSLYSSAPEDITRAMALAAAYPGGKGPKGPTQNPDNLPSFRGGPDAKNHGQPPSNTLPIPKPPKTPIGKLLPSSGATAVPVPAIVLGAIAALLLALGSAAYFARRRQLRRQGQQTLRPRHANGRNP